MPAQTCGQQKPVRKSVMSEYIWPALGLLFVLAVVVGFLGHAEEEAMPGYSIVSRIFRSAEVVTTARKAAEDRRSAEIMRINKANEAWNKHLAERSFAKANLKYLSGVFCPNANWTTLGPEEKQRVRKVLKEDGALLIESEACP